MLSEVFWVAVDIPVHLELLSGVEVRASVRLSALASILMSITFIT